jgi:threonine aldolase
VSLAADTIDLRSDTVTRPTPQMWERMREAPLGDDGLDGDPSVRQLEQYAAELLGKAAGLYLPSATMANLIAVMAVAGRGQQVVMEAASHIYTTERGGAGLSGCFYVPVAGEQGAMRLDALQHVLDHERTGLPTALLCLETSHNNAGGAVLPLAHLQAVQSLAQARGLPVHLDGARLFNAAVALGVPARRIAQHVDSVTVCLSKGLSAPVGAVLAGSAETIARGREIRKMLGGSQRQAGVTASAGLEGLQTMVDRLAEDHARARRLSAGLNGLGLALRAATPQTNIVMVSVQGSGQDSAAFAERLRAAGVLARPWTPDTLRCVTHRHIDDAAVDAAVQAFAQAGRAA